MKTEKDKPTGKHIKAKEETYDVKTWNEMIRQMEEQGLKPMVCDTPIPFFDIPVPCGEPRSLGEVPMEIILMPHEMGSTDSSFMARVSGDSMKDADIESGDIVRVLTGRRVYDGDVVLVKTGDEWTAKAYCVDEDGRPWLVPQNKDFTAFPLKNEENARVAGIVTEVVKSVHRVSYRECVDLINKAKEKIQVESIEDKPQYADRLICGMASGIEVARHWFSVYRVLADSTLINKEDFSGFCKLVASLVPMHEHLPKDVEMSRLNVGCFKKPLAEWNMETAPVKGKHYFTYLFIGKETEKLYEDLRRPRQFNE